MVEFDEEFRIQRFVKYPLALPLILNQNDSEWEKPNPAKWIVKFKKNSNPRIHISEFKALYSYWMDSKIQVASEFGRETSGNRFSDSDMNSEPSNGFYGNPKNIIQESESAKEKIN